jgi:protease-4
MRKSITHLILLVILSMAIISLSGCAFVNVSLAPKGGPLVEHLIEGKGKDKILIVDITGVITSKARKQGLTGTRPPLPSLIRESLAKARQDQQIKGVILRIDSPGGTVSASDNIYHEILEFRKNTKKPVYASITGMGTSGGYYVACAAENIHVHPTAVTGSIGVIAMQLNIEGLMEKIGIKDKTYKTGANKALFSPFRADTPDEAAIIQELLDSFHNRFVDIVFEARKTHLSRDEVAALADGRPYTAQQALSSGLTDAVSYLHETIASMADELDITDPSIIRYTRPGGHSGSIYSIMDTSISMVNIDIGTFRELGAPEFLYIWPGR